MGQTNQLSSPAPSADQSDDRSVPSLGSGKYGQIKNEADLLRALDQQSQRAEMVIRKLSRVRTSM